MDRNLLFPYLRSSLADPAGSSVVREVGHGLVSQVFEDRESVEGLEHLAVAPDALPSDDAHDLALANLIRFADESPALTIDVLGKPGDPVHFLLYSDHPRASSCLLLPDLYDHACEVLGEKELLACVPQRESLVVFPKRDRAYRELLVAKLRAIEADVKFPLTFELFQLAPGAVTPFMEP